jgi:hypothetical protein
MPRKWGLRTPLKGLSEPDRARTIDPMESCTLKRPELRQALGWVLKPERLRGG